MTKEEAVAYIENFSWSKTRLGLSRTRALLAALGDPQKELRFVHVAGSNGKGSTCAMIENILRLSGVRTGLYISPYLQDFCERIQLAGKSIPGDALAEITERVKSIAEGMEDHPSQFEIVTAIGMEYFRRAGAELVVLEVGMGGEHDATNAIDAPELAVITNLGLEHTEYLGDTIEKIAAAKAGIIKKGSRCVSYKSEEAAVDTVRAICRERGVPFTLADGDRAETLYSGIDGQKFRYEGQEYDLALIGPHQIRNAVTVLEAVKVLRERGWDIPESAVREGLRTVRWAARLELLGREPLFLLDGGHNPQCASALADSLRSLLPGEKVVFLTGVLADKDYSAIFDILQPLAEKFICLTPLSPRALPAEELAAFLRERGALAETAESIPAGIAQTLREAEARGEPALGFGSLYLAGALRTEFPAVMKKHLRQKALQRRAALSEAERETYSEKIVGKIRALPEFQNAKTVLLYRAIKNEVSLDALTKEPGKRFLYPHCAPDGSMTALCPKGEAWRIGAHGIEEPADAETAAPEEIDLVIVPCVGFDENGNRLGWGGGCYDRFLPRCTRAAVIAAAFSCQRLEMIPAEANDVPMDAVITENGIFDP